MNQSLYSNVESSHGVILAMTSTTAGFHQNVRSCDRRYIHIVKTSLTQGYEGNKTMPVHPYQNTNSQVHSQG